jgi:hypothetical protein
MVILGVPDLLPGGVPGGDFPGQTICATARVTAELPVGIQTDDQPTVDSTGLKGLAAFELADDPHRRPT